MDRPIQIPDFQTAYEELRCVQEEQLEAAVREAQEKTRRQLLAEMDDLRNEAALEMSLQRHSYEDEIASLNRALEERNAQPPGSPAYQPNCHPSAKSAAWDEMEAILQDTERRLKLPVKTSQVKLAYRSA